MIGTLMVLVVAVYVGSCLLAGYGPPAPLARFTADSEPLVRRFADPAAAVAAAYRRAAATAPGMRVAEAGGGVLLIDSRPTPRVLGGAFGLAMRLRFADGGEGCTVTAEVMRKVRFAVLVNHHAGFVHAERALRMAAKAHGVREVLPGIGDGHPSTPSSP